jgi:hypothetical protein
MSSVEKISESKANKQFKPKILNSCWIILLPGDTLLKDEAG